MLFEELGFDGFGVGERHHTPFISTAPPVVLSHIAALTSKIRLFTGVTLLSVLDPVRVAEDYATLDHLSGGRLELIIGKGNGPEQAELFGITRDQQWDTITENYRLLRQLWLRGHGDLESQRARDPAGAAGGRRGLAAPAAATASTDLAWQRHVPIIGRTGGSER